MWPGENVFSAASLDRVVGSRVNRRAAELKGQAATELAGAKPPSQAASPRLRRPKKLLPEDHLERAIAATTPRERGAWARKGLSCRGPLDRTTQAMLLRQLYLSHFALRQFERAYEVTEQALELEVLPDVMHQDAARARQAMGDYDAAAGHLRLAARVGPPSRKAFHWWTLGSVLLLAERSDEAMAALSRAARWGTTDKPLYQGHLALAKLAAGKRVRSVSRLIEQLEACPAGQGYGRFVLGQLAFHARRWRDAQAYLEAFVSRTEAGHRPMAIALEGELQVARQTLATIAERQRAEP